MIVVLTDATTGARRLSHLLPSPDAVEVLLILDATDYGDRTSRIEPMLIDTHCHLDFPDFAPEQAEIVARAKARGVARMITISTHVTKFAEISAIAERYDDVFCTVGTHPNHALDEPEASVAELVALARHPKCVGIGEAGLDYHYDHAPRDIAHRVFRTHIAAARESGLPLVIHTRDADDDCAAILRDEMGQGAFTALLHCFTGLARTGRDGGRTRPLHLLLGRRDLQELAGAARDGAAMCRWSGCWSRPTRLSSPRRRIAASATNRPMSPIRRAVLAEVKGLLRGRVRARDDRQCAAAVLENAAAARQGARRVSLTATILGCGSSGGVPRVGQGWGKCDPDKPAGTAADAARCCSRGEAPAATHVLIDTSPDLREQLIDADVERLDAILYTHPHADHTHGVDDVRGLVIVNGRRIPAYMDEPTARIMTR